MPGTTRTAAACAVIVSAACLAVTAPAAPAPVKAGYVGVWVQKN